MSSPLPEGLDAIERLLEASVARAAPGLRERVLAAARAQRNVRPLQPRSRSFWLAASAAAAVLFLLNFARSASFESEQHRPSRALCAALLRDADDANPFAKQLLNSCPPPAALNPIEE